ncbi:MAG: NAD-dependent epimerase/dehydratase family protein, partial [Candidatus Saccharimonadales bacterium]
MSKVFHSINLAQYTFVVTGGAGFIGSHLAEYLVLNGAKKVIVLDDLSNGATSNLRSVEKHANFEFIKGTICNRETCEKVFIHTDYVLHQAALCSVPRSIDNPAATHDVNVTGFLNVLLAARATGVKRIVYASSSSVYGNSKTMPKIETDPPAPLSPYAVSKLSNELYASVFVRNFGMSIAGLRYFNIFGPRQSPNGPYAAAIPLFVTALLEGKAPFIYGDGSQTRDFTYIENVVQANIKALFADVRVNGQVFNIATEGRTSVNELFYILADLSAGQAGLAGSNIKPIYN